MLLHFCGLKQGQCLFVCKCGCGNSDAGSGTCTGCNLVPVERAEQQRG